MYQNGAIILGCGTRSLRFRTPLDVTTAEVDEALDLMRRSLQQVGQKSA
jgi:L-lysine 6-transaminase